MRHWIQASSIVIGGLAAIGFAGWVISIYPPLGLFGFFSVCVYGAIRLVKDALDRDVFR